MSVRLTSSERKVALFNSTTGEAFGQVFESDDEAEAFLAFPLPDGFPQLDCMTPFELDQHYRAFNEAARDPASGELDPERLTRIAAWLKG